ncbi:MAG TPA: zf-HC2 domain-containing protein [Gemmataceae bacterium]|jgi:hypothetical protein|nr:zf-HC2 domain-containing protein [Gemmataceae bacterium]
MSNCDQARQALPGLLYGDLAADEQAAVEKHLQGCPACREDYAALQRVRRLLDTVPAPDVRVDLRGVYAEAARLQDKRLRRWRQAAVACLAAAAAVLIMLGLRLEVRLAAGQVTVRWGAPPEAVVHAPGPERRPDVARAQPPAGAVTPEEMRLAKELIHALAADIDARDRLQQQALARLQAGLEDLQRQADQQWSATERDVTALYTAHFGSRDQGANP